MTVPTCIDGPDGCEGRVEFRSTPDRDDLRTFARCEAHFELRLAAAEHTMELLSPARPAWFDESYAGERWDEDE